ncbi:hypothetical protein JX265_010901 [Neoarthrinium moseri]|uniref:Uncharacterized protein n=1 Tax=Neoarthrinium moseri TaxID=1658444 RepID=A0A9P9WDJ9_9PEZI|nr:uncharacterized protein JN550_008988 [Neoarthrinium moseri]KAI1846317.1 hypothetical protein JX266_007522 [Neoarthrinium moseri]KAI1858233.1 hypothetical protein JX265_010901 [Neoarthrinium moseri]KAI1864431.1 hypothetical protein JN550_008988 [Neoarthrinium moseri]
MSSRSPSKPARQSRSRRRQQPQADTQDEYSENYDDDSMEEEEEEEAPPPPRRRTKQRGKKQGGGGPLDGLTGGNEMLPVGQVGQQAGDLVNGAQGTLSNVAGGVLGGKKDDGGGKSDTLKLRLDLNLEVEVTLKARIHGDLTLALL